MAIFYLRGSKKEVYSNYDYDDILPAIGLNWKEEVAEAKSGFFVTKKTDEQKNHIFWLVDLLFFYEKYNQ